MISTLLGLAHYGMLPDFLQDMKNVGLTNNDLTPLFRSAEDFIQMWETCERQSQSLPSDHEQDTTSSVAPIVER